VDGGHALVAAGHPVAPVDFEVVEEGRDQLGVEVGEVELGGWDTGAALGEREQQSVGEDVVAGVSVPARPEDRS
jgi:hypothetical protein